VAHPLRRRRGGIGGLRRLLDEHGEAIEADLHRFYSIRLQEALFHPDPDRRYTARELIVRISALPPESALQRKLAGPSAAWSPEALLLRRIDLHLAGANWQRAGGKGQRPKPIELPGQRRTRQQKKPADDIARRLGLIPATDTT
jgi:hypothetical protein